MRSCAATIRSSRAWSCCSASSTCWSTWWSTSLHLVRSADPLLSRHDRRARCRCRRLARRAATAGICAAVESGAAFRRLPAPSSDRAIGGAAARHGPDRVFAPWLGTVDPQALAPVKRPRAVGAFLVRHRHARPRRLHPRALRRARLARRRPRSGGVRDARRSRDRPRHRLRALGSTAS